MNSMLAYVGGKSLLAKQIIERIPEHRCYCEVFAGAAWVLFKKEESPVEIINDINTDLVTLYRVVKHHLDEFIRYLRWLLVSREEFERFKEESPDTLTDIQRAVRFYYLLRNGYAGHIVAPSFSMKATGRPSFNLLRIEEDLSAAHLRLARVYIENLPYEKLISRVDKPFTFFYLDPPYYGFENYYGPGIFKREDFTKLADVLRGVKGKFMLSINNVPEIRQIFKGFVLEEVSTSYTIAGGNHQKRATELLIRNYEINGH
ncbi:MAG: adenine methyltransferase [Deltaproteobacteria bacterium HGW-Deltaproteobacteria-19]|nr:MAG: adenine methyltransferase [Deltaproteobacteria bacterium HGW-Deltaproteobacteria-19]